MPVKGDYKEINRNQFEALCRIHCTQAEICGVLMVTDKTLLKWCKRTYNKPYSEVYKIYMGQGKSSLRRLLWEEAMKGNKACLIFLAKNELGMTESPRDEVIDNDSIEEHNEGVALINAMISNPPQQRYIEDFENE